ncbi:MAG: M23 family metallopeptidase [Dehalococcoidia bacterium]|nr:M23 family metallopeptidase [Dehalococcoidia bacterium]
MALAAAAAVVLGVVFTSSSEDVDREISIARPKASPTTEGLISPTPTPTAGPTTPPILEAVIHDFRFPIDGACLPQEDELMPNAPREYRFGTHEGVDFYEGRCCVAVARGMPVLAAKTGVVIRADHDYQDITAEEMDALLTLSQQQGSTDAATLDRLRGRQVWVDHGNGIVTRYAHLLSVEAGIANGTVVRAGQVLGYVGNSGTPEGISDDNAENHLHFEIRVGDGYLGQGLSAADTRRLWERAFAP